MSLKDEIDKLIAAERARLKQKDDWNREGDELAKKRFRLLRSALEEVIKAVDPAYLRAKFEDDLDRAIIQVGQYRNNSFRIAAQWEIESRRSDFWVEKLERDRISPVDDTCSFDTETKVIQHILKKITPYIALSQHLGL